MKKMVWIFLIMFTFFLSLSAYATESTMNSAPTKTLGSAHEGLECIACHGVENPKAPFIKTDCSQCHDSVELAEITKDALPVNPHTSPHWGTNAKCSACHKEHGKNVYMCNDCHTFDTSSLSDFLK